MINSLTHGVAININFINDKKTNAVAGVASD